MKVSHLHSSCQRLTAHVDRGLDGHRRLVDVRAAAELAQPLRGCDGC
jgi:hypothetical protein